MFRSFSRLLVAAMSRDHVAVPAEQTTVHALKHCSLVGRCGRGISPRGQFGFVCFTRPDTRGREQVGAVIAIHHHVRGMFRADIHERFEPRVDRYAWVRGPMSLASKDLTRQFGSVRASSVWITLDD